MYIKIGHRSPHLTHHESVNRSSVPDFGFPKLVNRTPAFVCCSQEISMPVQAKSSNSEARNQLIAHLDIVNLTDLSIVL